MQSQADLRLMIIDEHNFVFLTSMFEPSAPAMSFSQPWKVSMFTLFLPSTELGRKLFWGESYEKFLHLKVFSEYTTALIASWNRQNTFVRLANSFAIFLFWWYYRISALLIGQFWFGDKSHRCILWCYFPLWRHLRKKQPWLKLFLMFSCMFTVIWNIFNFFPGF